MRNGGNLKWNVIPTVKTVDQFYDNEDFLNAFVENINKFDLERYEKVIFSYHGSQKANLMMFIQKANDDRNCEQGVVGDNHHCYKAACFETTKLLVEKLNLDKSKLLHLFNLGLIQNG